MGGWLLVVGRLLYGGLQLLAAVEGETIRALRAAAVDHERVVGVKRVREEREV